MSDHTYYVVMHTHLEERRPPATVLHCAIQQMMWRAEQVSHTLGIKTTRCSIIFHQLQVHMLARVINHLLKVILQTAKERSVDGRVLPAALQQEVPAEGQVT